MSNLAERKEIIERVGISALIGLIRFLVITISFSLLFFIIFLIFQSNIIKIFPPKEYGGLPDTVMIMVIPRVIGGIIGIRDGIRNYNHIAVKEIRQEYIKRISVYTKSAIIGLVAGALSSVFFGILFILLLSTDGLSIGDFQWMLLDSVFVGGLPSAVLASIILTLFKSARNNEKSIKSTYLITGLIVGVLTTPLYVFGNL